jgi:hypothetical protein
MEEEEEVWFNVSRLSAVSNLCNPEEKQKEMRTQRRNRRERKDGGGRREG